MGDLTEASLFEMSALLRAKEVNALELTEAHIARIERLDPKYRAFVHPTFDLARAMARAADGEMAAGHRRGPLHGIPIALKDAYDTAGIPTTVCSRLHGDRVPETDAAAWARLQAAGAVLLGKLECTELCLGGPSEDGLVPHALNPWDETRYAGGSSSGAGVALATGMVPGALGSDTGGSIRIPADLLRCGGDQTDLWAGQPVRAVSRCLAHWIMPGRWRAASRDCALLLDAISRATIRKMPPALPPGRRQHRCKVLTEDLSTASASAMCGPLPRNPAVEAEQQAPRPRRLCR